MPARHVGAAHLGREEVRRAARHLVRVGVGVRVRVRVRVRATLTLTLTLRYAWRENGEWKYDEVAARASIPHVTLPKGQDPEDFETWHIVDLHRYYFFQGKFVSNAR